LSRSAGSRVGGVVGKARPQPKAKLRPHKGEPRRMRQRLARPPSGPGGGGAARARCGLARATANLRHTHQSDHEPTPAHTHKEYTAADVTSVPEASHGSPAGNTLFYIFFIAVLY